MSGRQSAECVRAMRLFDSGRGLRESARLAGVAVSTLQRALKRRQATPSTTKPA